MLEPQTRYFGEQRMPIELNAEIRPLFSFRFNFNLIAETDECQRIVDLSEVISEFFDTA